MKPQIKSANRPRQIRGKWSHSFERYCKIYMDFHWLFLTVDDVEDIIITDDEDDEEEVTK